MPTLKNLLNSNGKHWLEASFDAYDQSNIRPPVKRETFSPSQAHLCPRALYYQMLGYEQDPINSQSLRRMSIGTLYHDFIKERLEKTGILVTAEGEVFYDNPPIHGFYDAIITNPNTDKQILLELKSMAEPKNPRYTSYLPKPDHLIQWNLYSLMTGINDGIIFYINKNNQEYILCETERNEDIINATLNKLNLVMSYLQNDSIVPYQPDWNHDWCPFKKTCERDYFIKRI